MTDQSEKCPIDECGTCGGLKIVLRRDLRAWELRTTITEPCPACGTGRRRSLNEENLGHFR